MPRRIHVWNGGDPASVKALLPLADALPELPPPRPLRRTLDLAFIVGSVLLRASAIAGELLTTDWGEAPVTWLYVKAAHSQDVRPGEPIEVHALLIPVRYVVDLAIGPTFTPGRAGPGEDLGVFAPTQPTPEGALPLADLEAAPAELHAPGLN
jgi:hypothetical protein